MAPGLVAHVIAQSRAVRIVWAGDGLGGDETFDLAVDAAHMLDAVHDGVEVGIGSWRTLVEIAERNVRPRLWITAAQRDGACAVVRMRLQDQPGELGLVLGDILGPARIVTVEDARHAEHEQVGSDRFGSDFFVMQTAMHWLCKGPFHSAIRRTAGRGPRRCPDGGSARRA